MPVDLQKLARALERRGPLLQRLEAEHTDCCRLFHGIAEGAPGIAIDRYGPILLVQTWREPLEEGELSRIRSQVEQALALPLTAVWNHRGKDGAASISAAGPHPHGSRSATHYARATLGPEIPASPMGREMGLVYDVRPRHRGLDPLLFLDLRAGRRRIRQSARGKSVLNLFAYTCASGVAAAAGGAQEVWNVDFSESALDIGKMNFASNGLESNASRFIPEDAIAVSRQLAALPVSTHRGRGGARRERRFLRFDPRSFDLVILDPPSWARGRFGAVDVVRDYPTLFKPALLSATPGASILATNHSAEVSRETFLQVLERTAEKSGRSIRALDWILPEEDFPSFDESPPLKAAWIEV